MNRPTTTQTILTATLLSLATILAPSAGRTQSDPDSRAKRAEEFAELFGELQATSLLIAMRASLEKQRSIVDDQDRMYNPVLEADPTDLTGNDLGAPLLRGEREAEQSMNAHGCINPPGDKRARYVATYVNVAPRIDTMGRRAGGFELREDKLAPEIVDRFMPEKIREGQPGVLILVTRGDGDWVYALDEAWPEPKLARRWLDVELGERVDEDNAVCEVANAVEALLEAAEGSSVAEVLRKRRLGARISEAEERLSEVRSETERDVSDTGLFASDIRPPLEQASQQLAVARQNLEDANYEVSSSAIELTQEHIAHARETYSTLTFIREQARRARTQLDRLHEQTTLRRIQFLPFGEDMHAQYQICEERVARFTDEARAGRSREQMFGAHQTALDCLGEFRAKRRDTQGKFDLYVLYAPLGSFGLLFVFGLVRLSVNANRRQTLKYEVTPEMSEWAQMVPMFERRLQRLKRRFPHVFDSGEQAALSAGLTREQIDTIDRAFAMTRRAAEILDEASRLQRESSMLRIDPLEDCRALLMTDSSELTTTNTSDATPIRRGVSSTETVPHRELLQATDRLTQRTESILEQLEASDKPDGSW
jgi:hypothetical protein